MGYISPLCVGSKIKSIDYTNKSYLKSQESKGEKYTSLSNQKKAFHHHSGFQQGEILSFTDVKKEFFIKMPPVESSKTSKTFLPLFFSSLKMGGNSDEKQ